MRRAIIPLSPTAIDPKEIERWFTPRDPPIEHEFRSRSNTSGQVHMPVRRAFTIVELTIVLLILAISAAISMDLLANTEAWTRSDRAAREALAAARYARTLAITTGGTYGIEFDTANARFQVFNTTGSNVVTSPLIAGGTYVINLSRTELSGVTMTPTIANDTTNPYDVIYNPLGSTTNGGTIAFTYANRTRTLTIPAVGDPTVK
jgi:prepilin-type N-terminal cleavage/methylation domain-containing protein